MCIFCKGNLKTDNTDYIEKSDNLIILVQNVPCEKCNQCGETYFDNSTVLFLERLINKIQPPSGDITLQVMNYDKTAA